MQQLGTTFNISNELLGEDTGAIYGHKQQHNVNYEMLKAKVRRRRLERVWRRTRYRHDRLRYRVQCNLCNRIMEKAIANVYANIILENSEDPKKLWKSINNILHRFPAPSLPENLSLKTICEKILKLFC